MLYFIKTQMMLLAQPKQLVIICIARFMTIRAATQLTKSQDNTAIHHALVRPPLLKVNSLPLALVST